MKAHWFILILAIFLCAVLAFIACGDDDDDDNDNDDNDDNDDAADDDDNDDAADDDDDDDDDDSGGDVWTDSTTGLMWQNGEDCCERHEWEEAIAYCENLSLGGFDNWRLPTISELRSLIRGCDATATGGSCGVTDSCLDSSCWNHDCSGCEDAEGPADGCYWPSEIKSDCTYYYFWSSSAVEDLDDTVWDIHFSNGHLSLNMDYFDYNVRCVR